MRATFPLATLLALLAFAASQIHAQSLTTLYSFRGGTDGISPYAGLVMDKVANLYGTTRNGGSFDYGTVFKLDTAGEVIVLHSFTFSDGAYPTAAMVMDKTGNLYGTTVGGVGPNCLQGCGVVFKLDTTGNETVLHSFANSPDGQAPSAGLIMDKRGNLYGTTDGGGVFGFGGYGTVFKLDPSGDETVLHSFANSPDGTYPSATLIMDKRGNLYGATEGGGAFGYGTVFKLDPSGDETVLHSFANSPDGANPFAGLIMDKSGNLYGTTLGGGAFGYGTVFKLDPSGDETVLHSFANSPDAANPFSGLVMDKEGNFYGTTVQGGSSTNCFLGCGVVFKLDPSGNETVLHSFANSPDGANPFAGLIMDKSGNLYGTTLGGGAYGYGTVFRIAP